MSDQAFWVYRIKDMLDSIDEIQTYIVGLSSPQKLKDDKKSFRAIERNMQIIADASKAVPVTIQAQYKQIDWKGIVDMRNFIVHEYGRVDVDLLWDAVQISLPPLKNELVKVLVDHSVGGEK